MSDKPGRRPQYPEDIRKKYDGAPHVHVRMEPDLFDWVQDRGGAAWLRRMLRELRAMAGEKGFARYWERLKKAAEDP